APAAISGPLSASAVLYQESSGGNRWDWSTHVNRNNVVPLSFRGWQLREDGIPTASGDRARGALDLTMGGSGVAVGIRYFWQSFPEALRALAPGTVEIALFPAEFPEPVEIQGGEEKTHEALLYFHRGDAVAAGAG